MAGLRFNTAIAKLIELNNALTPVVANRRRSPREIVEALVIMLGPLAPHVAEELWERLGHDGGLTYVAFPVADPAWLTADTIEIPVQVNGKVRTRVVLDADADEATMRAAALADDKVRAVLAGAEPRKVIVVPGRMINIVA
jgi:leucyl-tRNA synthetase